LLPALSGARERAQAIVCNSGISNVGTGERGIADAEAMCKAVAERLGEHEAFAGAKIARGDVLPASTGIIGRPLPMEKITAGIATLIPTLARGDDADHAAARAILTTDHHPKTASRTVELSTGSATIGGIAKGAGMIAPNMATMLAFLTTDADLEPRTLRQLLKAAAARTFNRVSIDGDTSTSDMVLVLANGAAGCAVRSDADVEAFAAALDDLCRDLAEQLVRDGEGVTRLMEVTIRGAATINDADRVGRAVVDSPLVKTALHGGDPNWGRLVMAVGKSGAKIRPVTLSIAIGGIEVLQAGEPTYLDAAAYAAIESIMQRDRVPIVIELGMGTQQATWIGCDLSREYITINADYTT
ncbi:MAG: bifunctional glutamate N-acetyltransferase/amino-acid acetyltransferase ArgJ, partial [Phycisphaeraceae bacterium]